jgi:hypothetical protein
MLNSNKIYKISGIRVLIMYFSGTLIVQLYITVPMYITIVMAVCLRNNIYHTNWYTFGGCKFSSSKRCILFIIDVRYCIHLIRTKYGKPIELYTHIFWYGSHAVFASSVTEFGLVSDATFWFITFYITGSLS